jgi:phosphatidylglycerophosphate synthase
VFDSALRRIMDPPLDRLGRRLAAAGVGADSVTLAGFAIGVAAAAAIAGDQPLLALPLIALNRLMDGLDGAVARASGGGTPRGGFLDVSLDFVFYGLIPLAFAIADPGANALAAAALLAAFYANGAAFLAFAAVAAGRGMTTTAQGVKSIYYLAGVAEGGETIAAFVLMCLFPEAFAPIAWTFAALTAVSAAARVALSANRL